MDCCDICTKDPDSICHHGRSQRSLIDAQATLLNNPLSRKPLTFASRREVPANAELAKARDLLRELYQAEYATAKSRAEQVRLAQRLLARVSDLGADVAGQYALLETAKQIAIQAGVIKKHCRPVATGRPP